jgi:hypothetical protein
LLRATSDSSKRTSALLARRPGVSGGRAQDLAPA